MMSASCRRESRVTGEEWLSQCPDPNWKGRGGVSGVLVLVLLVSRREGCYEVTSVRGAVNWPSVRTLLRPGSSGSRR